MHNPLIVRHIARPKFVPVKGCLTKTLRIHKNLWIIRTCPNGGTGDFKIENNPP